MSLINKGPLFGPELFTTWGIGVLNYIGIIILHSLITTKVDCYTCKLGGCSYNN